MKNIDLYKNMLLAFDENQANEGREAAESIMKSIGLSVGQLKDVLNVITHLEVSKNSKVS